MSIDFSPTGSVGAAVAAAMLVGTGMLAGCAADSPLIEQMTVTPGYFETLSCSELASQLHAAQDRLRQLTQVMEKSAEDPAGPFVNALAYNTEYAKARARARNAEAAAAAKGCTPPEPGPAVVSEPSSPPATLPAGAPQSITPEVAEPGR
jgi:hypothetical protein